MATSNPIEFPEYLTLDEVAKISRSPIESVRDWIARGDLPSTKPGRRRLVARHELAQFLATRGRIEAPAR